MNLTPTPTNSRTVLSVSELNREVASLLESEFSWTSVEGEISNLSRPASGHIYFTLKDSHAQIRCAMFKSRLRGLKFKPENGAHVVVRGKVSLYAARGDYQIIVDKMDEAGNGLLQRQFEQLKEKLASEGLFAEENKLDIPEQAGSIGVITSRSGAAIQDVLSVIARRFPAVPVKLFPVPVQGKESAPAICHAIEWLDEEKICDVILLVRGGGSLEDLWSFNEESVARAISACSTPIVCGVGHEVDFTIADFVADFRAATPTAAAEKVTPDQHALAQTLDWYEQRLEQLMRKKIEQLSTQSQHLQKRLKQQHPSYVLSQLTQRLDELEQRMQRAWKNNLRQAGDRALQLNTRLLAVSPAHSVRYATNRLANSWQRMQMLMKNRLHQNRMQLAGHASTLNALSPLQTLSRGYSITYDANGKALLSAEKIKVGDSISTRLHRNRLTSVIKEID